MRAQVQFKVEGQTSFGENLCIVGDSSELGRWDAGKSLPLQTNSSTYPVWKSPVVEMPVGEKVEYKYIVKQNSKIKKWEEGFTGNRQILLPSEGSFLVDDGVFGQRAGIPSPFIRLSGTSPRIAPSSQPKLPLPSISVSSAASLASSSSSSSSTEPAAATSPAKSPATVGSSSSSSSSGLSSSRPSSRPGSPTALFGSGDRTASLFARIDPFILRLVEENKQRPSWRSKLEFVTDFLLNTPDLETKHLAIVAAYMHFVSTGSIQCVEDGQHRRPNHHASLARKIDSRLVQLQQTIPNIAFLTRKIYPLLPSYAAPFTVSVPLTRIRDIAHRNDIPQDLKQEIKHQLQNKLHRCAGPEDLRTCESILRRITAPGAQYSGDFVHQFQIFHQELREFFNATTLDERLQDVLKQQDVPSTTRTLVSEFLALKAKSSASPQDKLITLTRLRQVLQEFLATAPCTTPHASTPASWYSSPASSSRSSSSTVSSPGFSSPWNPSSSSLFPPHSNNVPSNADLRDDTLQTVRLAEIGLEDMSFVLFSEWINSITDLKSQLSCAIECLLLLLQGLRSSLVEPEESEALFADLSSFLHLCLNSPSSAGGKSSSLSRNRWLHLKASLERGIRLANSFTETLVATFQSQVENLGACLSIPVNTVRVFSEGSIRSHIIFQFAKVVVPLLKHVRSQLNLPPWQPVVPGFVRAKLVHVHSMTDLLDLVGSRRGDGADDEKKFVALVDQAEGDEEIPRSVSGVILGHDLPHLSHLAVRARQSQVAFAASDEAEAYKALVSSFKPHMSTMVQLVVSADQVELTKADDSLPICYSSTLPSMSSSTAAALPAASSTSSSSSSSSSSSDATTNGSKGKGKGKGKKNAEVSPASRDEPALDESPVGALALTHARPVSAGAKASAALVLHKLAAGSTSGFKSPRGLFLPYTAFTVGLTSSPQYQKYLELMAQLDSCASVDDLGTIADTLYEWVFDNAIVADGCVEYIRQQLDGASRIMVRSSANVEDLPGMAGAGLYDSIANVLLADEAAVVVAIKRVWASLWTRRATASRQQAGLDHRMAKMAVLIQEMITSEYSFVLHTKNPVNGLADEVYMELAVGMGETLASAEQRGSAFRMAFNTATAQSTLHSFANFTYALVPSQTTVGELDRQRIKYSDVLMSTDDKYRERMCSRLGSIGREIETHFGRPQDIEGAIVEDDVYIVQSRPQV